MQDDEADVDQLIADELGMFEAGLAAVIEKDSCPHPALEAALEADLYVCVVTTVLSVAVITIDGFGVCGLMVMLVMIANGVMMVMMVCMIMMGGGSKVMVDDTLRSSYWYIVVVV